MNCSLLLRGFSLKLPTHFGPVVLTMWIFLVPRRWNLDPISLQSFKNLSLSNNLLFVRTLITLPSNLWNGGHGFLQCSDRTENMYMGRWKKYVAVLQYEVKILYNTNFLPPQFCTATKHVYNLSYLTILVRLGSKVACQTVTCLDCYNGYKATKENQP